VIKIMITVRNRLSITRKCIQALMKHSTMRNQIYVYDNLTSHKLDDHFNYFHKLYSKGLITQVTFNTSHSTFNAFSKAVACNQFGHLHEDDPDKDKYNFLVFLDNDIIVTPGWDGILHAAWKDVKKHDDLKKDIKVVGQLPGGIKNKQVYKHPIAGRVGKIGKLGGSGLWSVQPNFFRDVGYLDLNRLVNHNKKHDQSYWQSMEKRTNGRPYILGVDEKIGFHCGSIAGSVCNVLTRDKGTPQLMEKIKFAEAEEKIDKMNFDEFYKMVETKIGMNGW